MRRPLLLRQLPSFSRRWDFVPEPRQASLQGGAYLPCPFHPLQQAEEDQVYHELLDAARANRLETLHEEASNAAVSSRGASDRGMLVQPGSETPPPAANRRPANRAALPVAATAWGVEEPEATPADGSGAPGVKLYRWVGVSPTVLAAHLGILLERSLPLCALQGVKH